MVDPVRIEHLRGLEAHLAARIINPTRGRVKAAFEAVLRDGGMGDAA